MPRVFSGTFLTLPTPANFRPRQTTVLLRFIRVAMQNRIVRSRAQQARPPGQRCLEASIQFDDRCCEGSSLAFPNRSTFACVITLILAGVLAGFLQIDAMPGVPTHGRYHASDMDDLREQLLGYSARPKDYAAGPDHPAWYAICGIYQKTSSAFGLDGMELWNIAAPGLLGLNLALLFTLARQIGFSTFHAMALSTVWLGTAGTINWSVVLETHVLAPTSLLLAALILSHPRFFPRIWNRASPTTLAAYGLAIALAASITITNGALAALALVPARFVRRLRPRRLTGEMTRRFPTLFTAGLAGIGVLALVHTAGWYLVQDPNMQHFLEILGERRMLPSMEGGWWDSILALAWIGPPMSQYHGTPPETMLALDFNWTTIPAYVSGLFVLLLTACSLRVVPARATFIPLFALFGVLLHAIYGRGESFLYTANYGWATVISIGLLGRVVFPRSIAWIALVLGITMLVANTLIWRSGLEWIVENDYLLPHLPLAP